MAKNIQSLQLLRNTSELYATKEAALTALTGGTIPAGTQDGTPVLARYKGTDDKIYTLVGYYAASSAITGGTVTGESNMTVFDFEGSAADVEELRNMIGTGVTTTNTVTKQLQDLSGNTVSTSADTSVEGAKRYADDKVTEVVDGLDYTDTAVTGNYVSRVDESNGVITVTREALPTVAAISEAGKPITAVSESLGAVSATAGTINAEYVNVTGSVFSSSTVQAALEEIETEYKAADAAIVGDATTSGDTLGKLEDRIDELETDAKEYHIVKTTTGLPETIKESYSLVDAAGNVSGDTIDIPKDSHIVSITYNGTTQKLTYTYIDASGNTKSTDVDMSELILETEFASGVTVTNHIAHGVVDPTSETFLTVGENGFKLSGVQDAIDAAYEGLDATVSGATSGNHITISIEELDGKLVQSGLTISEDNIADADDLAALSAKTVTEIASSNNSISATSTAATDGTVSVDLVTDASKIQMSGFTSTDVLSGITSSSSITEAFKEVDKVITENEETVSAALNDLETTKVDVITVNGKQSKTPASGDVVASVTINGADIKLDGYASGSSSAAVVATDTVNQAIGKLENQVKAAVAGGLQQVEAGDGVSVSAVANNKQTITVNLKEDVTTTGSEWENPLKFDATSKGLYFDSLDCGTY